MNTLVKVRNGYLWKMNMKVFNLLLTLVEACTRVYITPEISSPIKTFSTQPTKEGFTVRPYYPNQHRILYFCIEKTTFLILLFIVCSKRKNIFQVQVGVKQPKWQPTLPCSESFKLKPFLKMGSTIKIQTCRIIMNRDKILSNE